MAANSPASALEQAKVAALLNGRYHGDREAWYEGLHRWLMLGVILFGSSALLDLVPWARASASLITVAFGAFDLVFSLSDRARDHSFLKKRYFEIASSLETAGASPDVAQAEMMQLAADETPPYYAVHALAENWAIRAVLGPDAPAPCKVHGWRKTFRHLFRFEQEPFAC